RIIEMERVEEVGEARRVGAAVDQHAAAAVLDQRRVALPHIEHADDQLAARLLSRETARPREHGDDRRHPRPPPDVHFLAAIIESRRALNSVPGFQVGSESALATVSPTLNSTRKSSTAPDRSQSGDTSSDGWW